MPEQKAEYTPTCPYCGRSDPQVESEQTPEQTPELICPLRMLAWDSSHKSITADCEVIQPNLKCLGKKCAWWMQPFEMCSIQAIPDTNSGLYEMLDEIRGKL